MKQFISSPYLSLIFRSYIGIVFIHASLSKIYYPGEFSEAVAAYQIIPYWAVNFTAVFMPWLELICGAFLLLGLFTKAAVSVIGSLLIVFIFAILLNLVKGAPISCGCFENVDYQISWHDIARDLGWLLLTVQVFFFDRISFLNRGIVNMKRTE